MKETIGIPARKDGFYQRDDVVENIYQKIDGNNNLLLSAPRRIGKSSILYYLFDEPRENYYTFYYQAEPVEEVNIFFRELCRLFMDDHPQHPKRVGGKASEFFGSMFSKVKSIKLFDIEIGLNDGDQDYYQKFQRLLEELPDDMGQVVIMIDEFPVTIENLANKHGEQEAVRFLKLNRALRQNPRINTKVSFVYTGSIGLYEIVKRYGATAEVNDLREIKVPPLDSPDAELLLKNLLTEDNIIIDDATASYLLDKIVWLIPFHIQLMASAIKGIMGRDQALTESKVIDKAFLNVVAEGNLYLDHYKSRLKKIFSAPELTFCNATMSALCQRNNITRAELFDLSAKHAVTETFNTVVNTLIHDGYLVENENETYIIYSPILKHWWKRNA